MSCTPSSVDVEALGRALAAERRARGGWVWQAADSVSVVEETASTNADLMAWAREAMITGQPWPERRLRLALAQTAGRGRLARPWTTARGTAWAWSLGLRLPVPLARLAGLTLACGLGVRDGLAGAALGLKWPNDLVLCTPPHAKVGGMLVEVMAREANEVWCVIGLGLNLTGGEALTQALGRPVGDLHAAGTTLQPAAWPQAIGAVVDAIEARVAQVVGRGFAALADDYNRAHVYHGQTVALIEGSAALSGRVCGVGAEGELCLQGDDGVIVRGRVGELSLRVADNGRALPVPGVDERKFS